MTQLNQEQLQKLLNNVDAVDNTDNIQNKKHSTLIREDIVTLCTIKKNNPNLSFRELDNTCSSSCFFLFKNYTQIYNMLLKNDLDIDVFNKLLDNLEKIENGELSQHDASIRVGQVLKSLYIDHVVKEKNDSDAKFQEEQERMKKEQAKNIKDISWKQFKNISENE